MHGRDSVLVGPFVSWELDSLGLWDASIPPHYCLPAQAKRGVREFNVLTYM